MEQKKYSNFIFSEPKIKKVNKNLIIINFDSYQVIDNYHHALDLDNLRKRYINFFSKFDYILGDMSGEQLRLTGFYDYEGKKGEKNIATCADFLAEFGTFDCPYFLLKKLKSTK